MDEVSRPRKSLNKNSLNSNFTLQAPIYQNNEQNILEKGQVDRDCASQQQRMSPGHHHRQQELAASKEEQVTISQISQIASSQQDQATEILRQKAHHAQVAQQKDDAKPADGGGFADHAWKAIKFMSQVQQHQQQ